MLFNRRQHLRFPGSQIAVHDLREPLRIRDHGPNRFLKVMTGGPGKLPQRLIGVAQRGRPLGNSLFQLQIRLLDSGFRVGLVRSVADRGGNQQTVRRVERIAGNLSRERRPIVAICRQPLLWRGLRVVWETPRQGIPTLEEANECRARSKPRASARRECPPGNSPARWFRPDW